MRIFVNCLEENFTYILEPLEPSQVYQPPSEMPKEKKNGKNVHFHKSERNKWIKFVNDYRSEHPEVSYKEALVICSELYKKHKKNKNKKSKQHKTKNKTQKKKKTYSKTYKKH